MSLSGSTRRRIIKPADSALELSSSPTDAMNLAVFIYFSNRVQIPNVHPCILGGFEVNDHHLPCHMELLAPSTNSVKDADIPV